MWCGNSAAPAAHREMLALSYKICPRQKRLQPRQDRQTDRQSVGVMGTEKFRDMEKDTQQRGGDTASCLPCEGEQPDRFLEPGLEPGHGKKQGWAQQILRSGFAFIPKAPGEGQLSTWALHRLQFSRCCSPPWSTVPMPCSRSLCTPSPPGATSGGQGLSLHPVYPVPIL